MLTFKETTAREFFAEKQCIEMLEGYRQEASDTVFHDTEPDKEYYEALEELGAISVVVAWRDNKPIGFVAVLKQNLPHFAGVPTAVVESFYVRSDARKGTGAGVGLWNCAKAIASSYGARRLSATAMVGSRAEKFLSYVARHTGSIYGVDL